MPNDQRPILQGRIVALLDRRVEGVTIDVGDAERIDLRMGDEPAGPAHRARCGRGTQHLVAVSADGVRHGPLAAQGITLNTTWSATVQRSNHGVRRRVAWR